MSGIVGIVNLSGEPVDRDLLWRLTKSVSFRGPDAQQIWNNEQVGFGHTMLRTTFEAESEQQPCTLDGDVWLTSDARIDGRQELIAKLEARLGTSLRIRIAPNGRQVDANPSTNSLPNRSPNDAELILYSYRAWGEDCLSHLIGDFVFAIWDTRKQRLFCARDQLGIRQFYYAQTKTSFVFSNTLDCVRLHPEVSSRLNEAAIGDFLLFGLNQDRASTTFTDIHRLPQGHSLSLSTNAIAMQEYWTPKVNPVEYKSADDYLGKFKELLVSAVSDRLRTNSVGISLSGGMDSLTVAAMAVSSFRQSPEHFELNAYCVVYDGSFTDQERQSATIVAEALRIPVEFLEGNQINKENSRRTLGLGPEPFNVDPIYVVSDELLNRISSRSRVALTGWDGDTFMSETPRHSFAHLLKRGNTGRLAFDLMRYIYFQRKPPPIGIRTRWRTWKRRATDKPPFPAWLNREFSTRLHLSERWERMNAELHLPHTTRPRAFGLLFSPEWSSLFARFDAGATLLPLEVRHPLIDLRVIEYLLAIPVIPWLLDKAILRRVTIGILPEQIRLRPKTPLAGDPGLQLRGSNKFQEIDGFRPVPALLSYVNREAIPRIVDEGDRNKLWTNVRPYSLNQWLMNCFAEPKITE